VDRVSHAIHVRTGQRASAEMVDTWLTRSGVSAAGFDDVYAACVYLLRHYAAIPDLALVGADWLGDDELSIVAYIRQTWPRTAIVVYGGQRETPRYDHWPLTRTVRGADGVRELTGRTPAEVVAQLCAEMPPLAAAMSLGGERAAGQERADSRRTLDVGAGPRPSEADRGGAGRGPDDAPRRILTDEELAALLDPETQA
jgi:hypothetical protein